MGYTINSFIDYIINNMLDNMVKYHNRLRDGLNSLVYIYY